jgi:hypothetical protein
VRARAGINQDEIDFIDVVARGESMSAASVRSKA